MRNVKDIVSVYSSGLLPRLAKFLVTERITASLAYVSSPSCKQPYTALIEMSHALIATTEMKPSKLPR